MKKVLLLLSFLGAMSCGGEPSNEGEMSIATEGEALTAQVECWTLWDCERCGPGFIRYRNVAYHECDDGTSTRVYTGPCGEACY